MPRLLIVIFLVFALSASNAQEFSSFTAKDLDTTQNYGWFNYVQVSAYGGQHLASPDWENFFNKGFWGLGMRLGFQSTGRKEWQRLHNYPQYGFGVSFFHLGGLEVDSVVGSPGAFYFFFGAPIARFGKFTLNGDVELGLSTDFNPYDPESNPDQNIIGASTNLHSNFSLQLYYQLSKRVDLSLGLSFLHFSNGRSFTPQQGINIFGLNLSSSYHFNPVRNFTNNKDPIYKPPVRPTFVKAPRTEFDPHHELILMATIGTVQAYPYEFKNEDGTYDTTGEKGPRYITNSISAEYGYQFARKLKGIAGLDLFYDGSAEYLYDDILPTDTDLGDKLFYGYHVGFHYLIERVAFVFNYGRYIYKPFEQRGNFWLRVGGRVGINDNLDGHIALKTRGGGEGGMADWIEWGIAYKIKGK